MSNKPTLKNNRFYDHRFEIKRISERDHCDISVASSKLVTEKNWTGYQEEMNEWNKLQRQYIKHPTLTLADLWK